MPSRTVLALLALCLLSAGCIGGLGGDEDELEAADDSGSEGAGGDQARPDATNPETPDPEPGPRVHSMNGSFTAEALNSGADPGDRSLEVTAPADAAAIVAELRWEGTADLDLALLSPQFCQSGPTPPPATGFACTIAFFTTGDAEHAYGTDRSEPAVQEQALEVRVDQATIQDEECGHDTCDWQAHVSPNLAVDTSFELKVSVFAQNAPGDGYSAFADG